MQIHNPQIPYITSIESRLTPGTKIRIFGWVQANADRFAINLKLGSGDDDEVALHFNPRFEKKPVVVRNSWTSCGWGFEERNIAIAAKAPEFPFSRNSPYLIEILCERARFRISVDGQLFAFFTYRLPLAYVTHIEIKGGTQVTLLEIPGNDGTGSQKSGDVSHNSSFNILSFLLFDVHIT